MSRYDLTNARKMEHAHPKTFAASWDTDEIDVGDVVKLENGGVRAWVTVTRVSPGHKYFTGTPDDPRDFGGAKTVQFAAWNVLDWGLADDPKIKQTGVPGWVLAAGAAGLLYLLLKK